jgi:pentatricopeptide repeat protein
MATTISQGVLCFHSTENNQLQCLFFLFNKIHRFSWNRRLSRYVKDGQHETTIELFHEMPQKGMSFDRFSFVPVLNACASLQAFEEGRQAHKQII